MERTRANGRRLVAGLWLDLAAAGAWCAAPKAASTPSSAPSGARVSAAAPAATADTPCTEPLRVGFSDAASPPLLRGDGPTFPDDDPGWNVVVTREAARVVGCPLQVVRAPGRRLTSMLERGDLDFAFTLGPTPERLQRLRFPLDAAGRPDPGFAIVVGRLALFTLAGGESRVGWDGRDPRAGTRIGVLAGSLQARLAEQRGWTTEPILAAEFGVRMLRGRRFDALLVTRETLDDALFQGPDRLVELQPEVERVYYYAAASRAAFARREAIVWRFWQALCVGSRRYMSRGLPACGVH